jgi:hypothetical protein
MFYRYSSHAFSLAQRVPAGRRHGQLRVFEEFGQSRDHQMNANVAQFALAGFGRNAECKG